MVFLIVGLGNLGNRYQKTRHNIGFMVVEDCARRWKKRFQKGEGHYEITETTVRSRNVFLVKPTIYMNRSGIAVVELLRRYAMELSHLLVVCDDLNLPLGKIRLRKKGSDGGHKGLASIISTLGTEEFPRLRLGIGFNGEIDATDYVLSPFLPSEQTIVNLMVERGGQVIVDFVQKGIEWTMNIYNS